MTKFCTNRNKQTIDAKYKNHTLLTTSSHLQPVQTKNTPCRFNVNINILEEA